MWVVIMFLGVPDLESVVVSIAVDFGPHTHIQSSLPTVVTLLETIQ